MWRVKPTFKVNREEPKGKLPVGVVSWSHIVGVAVGVGLGEGGSPKRKEGWEMKISQK